METTEDISEKNNKKLLKKRHELRKELKLLKLSNMKMKKQLRLAMRVRFLNRMRLEGEINQLNGILFKITNSISTQDVAENNEDYTNPESLKFHGESLNDDDSTHNNITDTKDSAIYTLPVKNKSEYRFFCDRCNFKCRKKGAFDIHQRRHTGEKPYSCKICDKSFVAKYELKLHQGKHTNERIYQCNECDYSTYRPDMLVNHIAKHSSIKVFDCELCEYKTDERCKLIDHRKESHSVFTECGACEKVKKMISDKNAAIEQASEYQNDCEDIRNDIDSELTALTGGLQHTCGKPWACTSCGISFKKRESLTKHMRTHTGERPFKCDRCNYAAAIKNTLIIHKRTHSGDKPYACDQCSFRCTTKSYLKIHLNKHNGIKPFACDRCDYTSVDSCKLSAHRQVRHSEDKPYACDVCPFRAKLKCRIRQHIRIHGPRSYVCPHCAKGFTCQRSLKEHEGTHTGVQPFRCEICKEERRFTLESTYKRHVARHRLKFGCHLCSYMTSLNKDLQRHLKVHDNASYRPRRKLEKTIHCLFCKYTCVQTAYLHKHMVSKHPNQSYDSASDQETEQCIEPVCENFSQVIVPTTQTVLYPLNPLILNIPNSQLVQMESSTQNLAQFPQARDYSSAAPAVDFTLSAFHRAGLIDHMSPLPSVIFTCDQCEFSIADPHELSIHRMSHMKGSSAAYSDGYMRSSNM
ncbi:uncharacterized protein LOC143920815 [Arctopsyche grandis]|uniref:uncharacterized protein LOC143920815 n=1 Tax=Arctopsyche grandis TaxID=121162 RepID=UPI00406D9086